MRGSNPTDRWGQRRRQCASGSVVGRFRLFRCRFVSGAVGDLRFEDDSDLFRSLSWVLSLNVSGVGVVSLVCVITPCKFNGYTFVGRSTKAIRGVGRGVVFLAIRFGLLSDCNRPVFVKGGFCVSMFSAVFPALLVATCRAFSAYVRFRRVGEFERVVVDSRLRS